VNTVSSTLQTRGVDRVGAVASSLCAAHCAICALLPAAFGALGMGALLGHEAEWVFTLIAIGFAAGALLMGWRRHRSMGVATLLVIGMLGLLASRGIEAGHEHGDHHHTQAVAHNHEASRADHHEPESVRGAVGTATGVLAGLALLTGHLLNLRASRCCDQKVCV